MNFRINWTLGSVRLGNRTIGVNLVPDFLVGGLWKPDFLLVGASFARDIRRRVASKARSYRMSEVPNSKRAFGNEFATTNACLLKLTPMVRLGNRIYQGCCSINFQFVPQNAIWKIAVQKCSINCKYYYNNSDFYNFFEVMHPFHLQIVSCIVVNQFIVEDSDGKR